MSNSTTEASPLLSSFISLVDKMTQEEREKVMGEVLELWEQANPVHAQFYDAARVLLLHYRGFPAYEHRPCELLA